jgi:hypothetical protein
VPLAYSRKFTGLFGTLGYPLVADLQVADLQKEDHPTALAKVERALDELDQLRAAAERAREKALGKLDGYVERLAELLKEAKTEK